MLMKVVVVGCTHAGTAAVRELWMSLNGGKTSPFFLAASRYTLKVPLADWKICFMLRQLL